MYSPEFEIKALISILNHPNHQCLGRSPTPKSISGLCQTGAKREPSPNAHDGDSGELYRRFGLNDREIGIIAGATPKRQYYYKTDEHQRIFDLALGPLSLAV